ncbi:prenyltransferase/squalene oxidase repeat-containing protein [Fimbriiglobus ruber]|nr:prenyltransferase/squalene oxidase repeat-containing protein [Fimbriiglobus ruber]
MMITDRLTRPVARLALAFAALAAVAVPATAQEGGKKKMDVDAIVDRGLEWLKKTQAPDGHWEAQGGQYPTSMTAMAGMCMLMHGSTLREGKYCDNIVKAVDWFMARSQASGLLGNPANPTESSRYTYGHGFGMLFLASVYGEEEDGDRRKKLEVMLKKAVEFCGKAQTDRGGWGYVSAKDGGNFDEGSTTITQLQGLRAARNAGIPVPKEIIDKATKYLHDCTTPRGGIIYSLAHGAAQAGQERPALTAAAVACAFSSGQYKDEYAKKWIKYCKENIPLRRGGGQDEYQSYYLSQALYVLGEDRYGDLFPKDAKDSWLTWSAYKKATFDDIQSSQNADGSWNGVGYVGPVFGTCINLTILQLDKATLPIYHR